MNNVVRFALGDKAATAALGINITTAEINAKTEAGPVGLAVYGCTKSLGCCVDYSGNIYISDSAEHAIYKIDEGGKISIFAGLPGTSGNNNTLQNVAAGDARFNAPNGLACDKSNNIYVADVGNNQIRVINSGRVSVLAGSGAAGMIDSADTALSATQGALAAQFNGPSDIDVDAKGTVYVCDQGNHAIRKIDGSNVLTMAGSGIAGDIENAQSLGKNGAFFNTPRSVCSDVSGNIYVSDTGNFKIKKITPSGFVYLHSGSGVSGRSLGDLAAGSNKIDGSGDSNPYTCEYVFPFISSMDKSGTMYLIDRDVSSGGVRLMSIDKDGVPSVICEFVGGSGATTAKGVAVSPGNKLFVTMSD